MDVNSRRVNFGPGSESNRLLDLKEGDIIRLNVPADDRCRSGTKRFTGQMGLRRFRKSVQVTSVIDTEKDAVKRALKEFEVKRKERISGVKDIIRGPLEDEEEEDE